MTTKHTISQLRMHLFDVIDSLKSETPMETARAETICLAAKRLLESAEVEIKYRGLMQRTERASNFLEDKRA